jgi:RNA polymerase sigma-70 factor, ECF subfamily
VTQLSGEPPHHPGSSLAPPEARSVDPGPLSFEEIYEAHVSFLWRALRLLGVPPEQVEDAAQDVLLVIHRRSRELNQGHSIRGWIVGIARRVAANYARQRRRKAWPLVPLDALEETAKTAAPTHAASVEAAEVIRRFFATLDEGAQAIFLLALVEQLSAAAVGAELGLPTSTVHTRVRILRRALHDFMETTR